MFFSTRPPAGLVKRVAGNRTPYGSISRNGVLGSESWGSSRIVGHSEGIVEPDSSAVTWTQSHFTGDCPEQSVLLKVSQFRGSLQDAPAFAAVSEPVGEDPAVRQSPLPKPG
jgi:hypothetical protein